MSRLRNQIAVVTGASSGVGKAIALKLATHGAKLCLVGRNMDTLEAVVENVRVNTPQSKGYRVDLTVDEDVRKLKVHIQQDFGYIDILVHSAGVFSMGLVENAPVEDFDWQYKTNVRAPYLLTQVLLPIIRLEYGQIVFINSTTGLNSRANVSQYAATKHALKAVADSLRAEVNARGIRVLSVYPGRTATPMQANVHEMEGKVYHPERFMQPEDVAEVVVNAITLSRAAEVTDISVRPLTG